MNKKKNQIAENSKYVEPKTLNIFLLLIINKNCLQWHGTKNWKSVNKWRRSFFFFFRPFASFSFLLCQHQKMKKPNAAWEWFFVLIGFRVSKLFHGFCCRIVFRFNRWSWPNFTSCIIAIGNQINHISIHTKIWWLKFDCIELVTDSCANQKFSKNRNMNLISLNENWEIICHLQSGIKSSPVIQSKQNRNWIRQKELLSFVFDDGDASFCALEQRARINWVNCSVCPLIFRWRHVIVSIILNWSELFFSFFFSHNVFVFFPFVTVSSPIWFTDHVIRVLNTGHWALAIEIEFIILLFTNEKCLFVQSIPTIK